jgi:hypothetical protein
MHQSLRFIYWLIYLNAIMYVTQDARLVMTAVVHAYRMESHHLCRV